MAGKKRERHWYIIRVTGSPNILGLISAFSSREVKRKFKLSVGCTIVEPAKRWHVSYVFSGLPVFYEYLRSYGSEDVRSYVPNDFHIMTEGKKILVAVLG